MSTRNLTDRSPLASSKNTSESDDSQDPRNPFIQDELNSYDESNSSEDSTTNLNGKPRKPFIDYKGYYNQNGSSSNSLNHNAHSYSSSNISGFNQNQSITNDVYSPPEYDRYPSIGGSRVASMTNSISSNVNLLQSHNKKSSILSDKSSNSEASSNPFLVDADFSPFGGYPASSFPLHIDEKEPDDYLHNPDPIADAYADKHRFKEDWKNMDKRSLGGLLGLLMLFLGAIALFVILPALTYSGVTDHKEAPQVVEILTYYSYPTLSAIRTSLVDPDTPESAYEKEAKNGDKWQLVFSDEFNAEGRTFYDGDDQFWTAVDIHYDATKDLEWYDPDAATTSEGTLQLKMDAFENHDLFYRSGMVQSWNKMCFTQGNIEVSAMLPNYGNVSGLWPGIWTLGNLARAGYLASTQGVWPYTYESCDAGITPNQSATDGISYLPGQKLSVCTCDGEDHPNQGTGRGATEIDALEGSTDTTLKTGVVSQSMQIAPYDIWYIPDYDFIEIHNTSVTAMNTYCGGPFQQAVSAVSTLNPEWYENGVSNHYFQKYGFEYLNDDDDGYCMWFVGDDPTFTLYSQALHPDGNVDWRRISKEPMSIILNLGVSKNWAYIDWPSIIFPSTMRVDYVRVYQPADAISVTCDPTSHPTTDYILNHRVAYYNANVTSWEDAGYDTPKNILTGNCKSSKFSLSS